MSKSKIEWTGETLNPFVGCSIVSPGCRFCYAMKMAARIETMGGPEHYRGLTMPSKAGPVWTGKLALAPNDTLTKPLHRRKPTTYFVNSMSDLFHEDVPDEWIDRVFAVMALCPLHTFQVLTKRSARMRAYMTALPDRASRHKAMLSNDLNDPAHCLGLLRADYPGARAWPLPNVWLGVSTERQQEADERIPDLLATPAAVRFVSAEPLLGPVNLKRIKVGKGWQDALAGWRDCENYPGREETLNWIIVGGESGPNARVMDPDWARSIRDQCAASGVSFFMKQMTKKTEIPSDLFIRQTPSSIHGGQ